VVEWGLGESKGLAMGWRLAVGRGLRMGLGLGEQMNTMVGWVGLGRDLVMGWGPEVGRDLVVGWVLEAGRNSVGGWGIGLE
jgi:hypothetical protein